MPDGLPLIDPDLVAGRIASLLRERRCGAVKPLLAALEKLAPGHADLALLRVTYCCQIGDVAQALKLLDDEIAQGRGNPALSLKHAEILFAQGDYAGAAVKAADTVLAAPTLLSAKSVLGLALLKLGQFDSALPCLAESFAADPASADVALALAALSPAGAVEVLNAAIAATPQRAMLRNALARRYLSVGDAAQALRIAGQSRADGLADAETHCLLAFAQMQECCWDEAGLSVAQAQSLAPGNSWAARLAGALEQRLSGEVWPQPQPDAQAAERALFAGSTILPGTFRALIEESQISGPVLDLCCGTGLNAIAAQGLSGCSWTGADPDPAALSLCKERGLYAMLENCNPRSLLARGTQYAIILMNEALAYSASPQPWFIALRKGLAPGGMALAAIPIGKPGLTGHALFSHSLSSIAEQAKQVGLTCHVRRSGILRYIEGIPSHGAIASFQPF